MTLDLTKVADGLAFRLITRHAEILSFLRILYLATKKSYIRFMITESQVYTFLNKEIYFPNQALENKKSEEFN